MLLGPGASIQIVNGCLKELRRDSNAAAVIQAGRDREIGGGEGTAKKRRHQAPSRMRRITPEWRQFAQNRHRAVTVRFGSNPFGRRFQSVSACPHARRGASPSARGTGKEKRLSLIDMGIV